VTREPIDQILEPAIDEARIQSNWHQIVGKRAPSRRERIPRWSFAVAAAAIAGVLAVVAWPGRHGGPLASTNPAIAVNAGAVVDAPVTFDDGSVVELAAGARLEVLTNESDRFVTLLRHGRVHFDVQPGGPRRWEIETSRATVEVVGTAFVVEASEHRVTVEVERGVVVVRGERVPDRAARLTAGQHLVLDDGVTADLKSTHADPTPAAVAATTHDVTDAAKQAPTDRQAPTDIAKRDTDAAKPKTPPATRPVPSRVTDTTGAAPTDAAPKRVDIVATLLADADQRRAAGDPAGAAALLEQALAKGRHDESTGLVAFTLGRLYLDELGAPDKAAAAFAKMIELGAPRALLEDAYARRIEALVRANRMPVARDALADYDRLYPHGVRRAALHTLVK